MEQRLVRWDMAWVWPTTTTHRAQETRRHYAQAALRLHRRDLERPNDEISARRDQRASRVDRMAQANAERQVRSKGMPHVGYADSVMNNEHAS